MSTEAPASADARTIEARLEDLERELARLKDIDAIRRLQHCYNYYNSSRLYRQLLDLVSQNAESIEIAGRGVFYGKAGFAKNFHPDEHGVVHDRGQPFGNVLFQLAGQDVITLAQDGRSALGRFRVVTSIYFDFPDTRPRFNAGDYEMKYVKEDGGWRIARLKYVHNYAVTFEADGTVRPGYSQVGDGSEDAPTTWYHPWPETGVLPFHFPNPVTGEQPPDVASEERHWPHPRSS